MKITSQLLADVYLIEPNIIGDKRGYFVETFRQDKLENAIGYRLNFVQDNESKSVKGVLRGLHFQLPPDAQAKLVRVIEGRVLDVAVDLRKSSQTFGKYIAVELSSENKKQLFIPRGFAHGFLVLSESATFSYKVDSYYSSESDRGLAFNDPALNINWQLPTAELLLSDKDKNQPTLSQLNDIFE
jgi:dTDP-4-dehydrorhamnose 3,5-epimerase